MFLTDHLYYNIYLVSFSFECSVSFFFVRWFLATADPSPTNLRLWSAYILPFKREDRGNTKSQNEPRLGLEGSGSKARAHIRAYKKQVLVAKGHWYIAQLAWSKVSFARLMFSVKSGQNLQNLLASLFISYLSKNGWDTILGLWRSKATTVPNVPQPLS